MSKKLKTVLLLVALILLFVLGFVFSQTGALNPNAADCRLVGGTWVNNSCRSEESDKGFNETECTRRGGKFNACASACPNLAPGQSCIHLCVKTCDFN